jgi:phage baseplate assembly protein W
MQIDWPLRIDGGGRIAITDDENHVRDLIEQVLFTAPGERVNRPDFGTGLLSLVFAPNDAELATTTDFMVQGALQQWLGDVIQVEAVDVTSTDARLEVVVQYRVRRTQERRVETFERTPA